MAALGWLLNLGFAGGSVPTDIYCTTGTIEVTGLTATVESWDELTCGRIIIRTHDIDLAVPTEGTNVWTPETQRRTWYPSADPRHWPGVVVSRVWQPTAQARTWKV
jgi:hypothetical protein